MTYLMSLLGISLMIFIWVAPNIPNVDLMMLLPFVMVAFGFLWSYFYFKYR